MVNYDCNVNGEMTITNQEGRQPSSCEWRTTGHFRDGSITLSLQAKGQEGRA